MNKPMVLVAGTLPAIETVRHLLGTEVQYMPARSLAEALRGLEAHPDLILCNVRFDESRMLDLLQAVKAEPATRDTPFVCFRLAPLTLAMRRSIEISVLALGALAFVDLSSPERDAAETTLREIIHSHLPPTAGR